ncbi:phosphoglycerate mutase [Ottowia pentelensis]|uniref:phosphoglycerate mutase n=1 Tax=Ottowia pentelensis TaxID=511108 RepID=UPI00363D93C2
MPKLQALLARMRLQTTLEVDEDSPATPFEQALARAHGLPGAPGRVAWAAFETGTVGTPCAWLRPCHWQVGMDQVSLLEPSELALSEAESRALLAALQPLLQDDGLTLRYLAPDRWLAQGELLRDLGTASMARALQQPLTRELLTVAPDPAQGARLRRLQGELEMLLYLQPVNDAREAARRYPVNAVWIEGAGALDAPVPIRPNVRTDTRLQTPPASTADYLRAWQAIDAEALAPLLAAQRTGAKVELTLCGARRALTLTTVRGLLPGFMNKMHPLRLSHLRNQL